MKVVCFAFSCIFLHLKSFCRKKNWLETVLIPLFYYTTMMFYCNANGKNCSDKFYQLSELTCTDNNISVAQNVMELFLARF